MKRIAAALLLVFCSSLGDADEYRHVLELFGRRPFGAGTEEVPGGKPVPLRVGTLALPRRLSADEAFMLVEGYKALTVKDAPCLGRTGRGEAYIPVFDRGLALRPRADQSGTTIACTLGFTQCSPCEACVPVTQLIGVVARPGKLKAAVLASASSGEEGALEACLIDSPFEPYPLLEIDTRQPHGRADEILGQVFRLETVKLAGSKTGLQLRRVAAVEYATPAAANQTEIRRRADFGDLPEGKANGFTVYERRVTDGKESYWRVPLTWDPDRTAFEEGTPVPMASTPASSTTTP